MNRFTKVRRNKGSEVPRLLTIKEASEAMGLPPWRVYQLVKRGEGPRVVRLGKRAMRVTESALCEWIQQCEQGTLTL
jgi:excisionase family DNA binding protein